MSSTSNDTSSLKDTTSLKDRLREDLTAAMKRRDDVEMSALRMALTAISVAETAGDNAVVLSDEAVQAVLAVEVRKHAEAAEAFGVAGRPDRVAAEQAEQAVLQRYLPAALSADDLAAIIDAEIAAAAADGATGMKAMGRVVAAARAKAGPTADGAQIAALVKSKLQS
jgi:uncharacterized protein YqeY